MNSNVSKFLAAITLASSAMSSFNGCISGMEVKNSEKQKIIDDLSREFLKFIENNEDFSLFENTFGALSWAICSDPKGYKFYEEGITVGKVLDNIKAWMKDTGNTEGLINVSDLGRSFKHWKRTILSKYKNYGQEKMDKYIDFIFEQISKNTFKDEKATDEQLFGISDFIDNVCQKVKIKFKEKTMERLKIEMQKAMERLKIERQKAEEERNNPNNLNINQCVICLDNASKDKKDIMIKCCKKFMHQGCYDEYLKAGGKKCPYCNQPFDKDPLNINK